MPRKVRLIACPRANSWFTQRRKFPFPFFYFLSQPTKCAETRKCESKETNSILQSTAPNIDFSRRLRVKLYISNKRTRETEITKRSSRRKSSDNRSQTEKQLFIWGPYEGFRVKAGSCPVNMQMFLSIVHSHYRRYLEWWWKHTSQNLLKIRNAN